MCCSKVIGGMFGLHKYCTGVSDVTKDDKRCNRSKQISDALNNRGSMSKRLQTTKEAKAVVREIVLDRSPGSKQAVDQSDGELIDKMSFSGLFLKINFKC